MTYVFFSSCIHQIILYLLYRKVHINKLQKRHFNVMKINLSVQSFCHVHIIKMYR